MPDLLPFGAMESSSEVNSEAINDSVQNLQRLLHYPGKIADERLLPRSRARAQGQKGGASGFDWDRDMSAIRNPEKAGPVQSGTDLGGCRLEMKSISAALLEKRLEERKLSKISELENSHITESNLIETSNSGQMGQKRPKPQNSQNSQFQKFVEKSPKIKKQKKVAVGSKESETKGIIARVQIQPKAASNPQRMAGLGRKVQSSLNSSTPANEQHLEELLKAKCEEPAREERVNESLKIGEPEESGKKANLSESETEKAGLGDVESERQRAKNEDAKLKSKMRKKEEKTILKSKRVGLKLHGKYESTKLRSIGSRRIAKSKSHKPALKSIKKSKKQFSRCIPFSKSKAA